MTHALDATTPVPALLTRIPENTLAEINAATRVIWANARDVDESDRFLEMLGLRT